MTEPRERAERRPLPWPRRLAYWGVLVVVLLGLCEVLSLLAFCASARRGFSFADLQNRRVVATEGAEARGARGPRPFQPYEVVHPYLGYVTDPTHPDAPETDEQGAFRLEPAARLDRTIVVGVYGGSVAGQVLEHGAHWLREELEKHPAYQGRPIAFVNASMGGYKQPQQALSLSYLYMLGGHLDLVINLDGFNDIVLPVAENMPADVYYAYPRGWAQRTAGLADARVMREVGSLTQLRGIRAALARWLDDSILRRLVTPNVLWFLVDRQLEKRIGVREQALRQLKGRSYLQTGPLAAMNEDEVLARSADLWVMGSRTMNALAREAGSRYFHFLQPNQYVAGSKPLTEEERRTAYDMTGGGFGPIARKGYPILVEASGRLRDAGVEYHDLTGLFAGDTRTLYVDTCCHLNPTGIELLSRRIGQIVVARLAAEAPGATKEAGGAKPAP